jgi:hypothetical protein
VQSWRCCQLLLIGMCMQVFVLLIYPFKYSRYILFAAYFGLLALPLLTIPTIDDRLFHQSFSEIIFFAFVAYQWAFWLLTIGALFFGQVWCERRFASLEH